MSHSSLGQLEDLLSFFGGIDVFSITSDEPNAVAIGYELSRITDYYIPIAVEVVQGRYPPQDNAWYWFRRGLPVSGTVWTDSDGYECDMSAFPDLMVYVELLNELRLATLERAERLR